MTIHCLRSVFTPLVLRKNPSVLYINKDFYDFKSYKTITNKVKEIQYSNCVSLKPVSNTNLYSCVLDITSLDYMFMYLHTSFKLYDDNIQFVHPDTIEYAEEELKRCLEYYNIKDRIDWFQVGDNTYINIKNYL